MAVDTDTVKDMALLARIDLPADRLEAVAAEMSTILEFMGAISKWDGDGVVPPPPTARRPDVAIDPKHTALIEAAAHHEAGQIVVPPIKGAS